MDDNHIEGNHILRAGRMGIEDWGTTRRTIVRGNTISGSGVVDATNGFGISAAGKASLIEANHVSDFHYSGIEFGSSSMVVGNTIAQQAAGLLGTGYALYQANIPTWLEGDSGASIVGNHVANTEMGFILTNDADVIVDITLSGNTFKDYRSHGIWIFRAAATPGNAIISGNTFRVSDPTAEVRTAVRIAGSGYVPVVIGNSIVYEGTATGGTADELAIWVAVDNARVSNNFIDGQNITFTGSSGGGPTVKGIDSRQLSPTGVQIVGNTLIGGAYIQAYYLTTPFIFANVGTVANFEAKPVITGSRGANAALADLLTSLATLGLITDSSS
jgi:hypothetical protein